VFVGLAIVGWWHVTFRLDGVEQTLVVEAATGDAALEQLRADYAAGRADSTLAHTYTSAAGGQLVVRWGRLALIGGGTVTAAPPPPAPPAGRADGTNRDG
jgi:hypothetical protein